MKIKVAEVGEGIHPSEVVVSVATVDGSENLVVSKRSLKSGSLEVGYPIRVQDGTYLVELPRETLRGQWRVWIKQDQFADEERLRA